MTDALAPFAAALLLAYLLEPIARRLTGLGLPRAFSSVVAILVGLVVVVSMVSIGVPVVSHEIGKLQARLPDLIATLYAQVYPWLAQTGLPIDDTEALRAKLIDWLGKNTEQVSNTFFSTLQTGLGALVTILGWFILVPVVLFFLLKDWAMIMGKTIWAVPQKHRAIVRSVGCDIHDTLQGYLQGQVRVMAAMALLRRGPVVCWLFGLALDWPALWALGLHSLCRVRSLGAARPGVGSARVGMGPHPDCRGGCLWRGPVLGELCAHPKARRRSHWPTPAWRDPCPGDFRKPLWFPWRAPCPTTGGRFIGSVQAV